MRDGKEWPAGHVQAGITSQPDPPAVRFCITSNSSRIIIIVLSSEECTLKPLKEA